MTSKGVPEVLERQSLFNGRLGRGRTPLVIFVPIRVTKPLTLSERNDDKTRVEPGSTGASSFTHSSRPSFKAVKDDCRDLRYHCSSFR